MKDIRQRISTLSFGATSVFSVLVVVVVFLIPARGVAQFPPLKKVRSADSSSGFVNRVFVDEDGEHRYAVFIPPNYTPHRRWPTVLFLHGASNRGTDGRSQLVTGLPAAIRTNPDQYPFLAVFPQCEDTRSSVMTGWTDDPREAARALRILSEVEREFSVDREHELLAGLSMGANGVYEIAAQDPQRWRGLIVVSGRCSESIASRIASIPLWVFHSRKDALIPFEDCQRTIDLIRDAGGHVNFSEVPGEAHDISAVTFTQSELARWVLHPEIPPQTNLLWTKPEGYTSGINEEVPFLPGAKLPGAIQVKVAPDLLVAVSEQLQEEYASQPLQGSSSPRQQSRRSLIGQFDVSVAGARYTGRVDQVQVTAEPSQVLRVQIGLRNVVMTIARTQIESPLVKANAGPVRIVVGHRAPVWITMNIAPSVHQERVRLRVVGTSFQIPSNNWSVQRPTYVNVRGLPFMKRRISDSIVEGIYQRKPEIEREVRQNIPQIVSQMESRLNNELLDQILVVGQIPVPMWQPRVKLTPESIEITEQGITAQLGITMAAVGKTVYDDNNFQMRVYPRTPAEFPMPATGAQLAISCQFVTALTELMIAGEVNTFHAQDLRH
ncbi:MAG: hypothetical protein KDA80_09840, partial [Planctomycetaceae bacterium]|nr:hypothetical protein [Planctomycetaceae bacterium]